MEFMFQYPKVRLKAKRPRVSITWTLVSIPEGAIEGPPNTLYVGRSTKVSIPEGAIEGPKKVGRFVEFGQFQYPKVRLKVFSFMNTKKPRTVFQYPKVRLKGGNRRPTIRPKIWFQYPKVRLKVLAENGYKEVLTRQFQYPKVRLKGFGH